MAGIKILFRVNAGFQIGLGHLHRCLALASALRQLDRQCIFLTNNEPSLQGLVESLGFTAYALEDVEPGGDIDWRRTSEVALRHQCDGIIVDSYDVDAGYLSRLRGQGLFVTAIDDLAGFHFPCHLVVNGSVQAESLLYQSSTGDTRFLLGPEYALLREPFWYVHSRTVKDEVRNVLVTMGGADGRNLTPAIVELLDLLAGDFGVTVTVGPFFKNGGEVETLVERCRHRVRLVRSPDSLRDLMLEADLAVSAGGQTLYELAATGTPAVAVQVAENQAANIQSFAQKGVISPIIFDSREHLLTWLAHEISILLGDPTQRIEMSQSGQRLVDGLGALRVGECLAKALCRERAVCGK